MVRPRGGVIVRFAACAAIWIVVVFVSGQAAFSQDKMVGPTTGKLPDHRWFTLESEHFLVHFNAGSQALAKEVAGIAEDVHARLTKEIKWELSSRTHIVILDWYDSINAWASPLPRNTIVIYPVGPGVQELELSYTDDWLRLVITHEYTHTLSMDMVSGVLGVFRSIFGRSLATVPNAFLPKWMLEGYAIYEETKHTSGGRIRGTYFDMVLRCAVLEGKFNTISQAQSGIDVWPMSTHYIYGGMFFQYLVDTFGEGRVFEIFKSQSCIPSPYMPWLPAELEFFAIFLYWIIGDPVGGNAAMIFGCQSYERLWSAWHAHLKERYRRQRAEIEKRPLTRSRPLTGTGYQTSEPRFSPDGRHIAYISRGGDRYTQLRLMDADGSSDRLLYQGAVQSLSWSPDGRKIAFAMLDFWRGTFFYSDLYVYDLRSRGVTRLTHGLRVRTPAWSPDGKRILFAVNTGGGNSDLAVLDLTGQESPVTYLTHSRDFSFYSGCTWSPDGTKIAYVRLASGKLQQIYVAAPDGTGAEALTDGLSQDLAPAWSPDGKYLLFTSSRTGAYNIFAYSFETRRTLQLTNVIGGAISPSLCADGETLAFAGYSSSGWDIQTRRIDMADAPEAAPRSRIIVRTEYETLERDYEVRNYHALETILPTAWMPFSFSAGLLHEEMGVIVAGMDVLEKHSYLLQLGYNPKKDRPVLGLIYDYMGNKYRGVPVVLSFEAFRQPVLLTGLMQDQYGDFVDYWEDRALADISLTGTVWRSTQTNVKVSLGYEFKSFGRISHLKPGCTVPGTGRLSSVYLSGLFDDTKLYPLSISPTDGRAVRLSCKCAGRSLGSDYQVRSCTLRWSEYVSVPWAAHHVVMALLAGGVSEGDVIDRRSFFQVGGLKDFMSESESEFFQLRGYKASEFLGTRAALITLEYRLPLWLIEGGPATKPVFFRKLSGFAFVDCGNAWSRSCSVREFKAGAGAGLRLAFDLFYRSSGVLCLELGIARGFGEEGIDQIYLTTTLLW